jgi:hypothetical protein
LRWESRQLEASHDGSLEVKEKQFLLKLGWGKTSKGVSTLEQWVWEPYLQGQKHPSLQEVP